jgi:hypothetical protein
MQNREELRQKAPRGVEKRHIARGGKNIIFRRGGGINIVFGPKYRPLQKSLNKQKFFGFLILSTVVPNMTV